jgi:hypothetical protein
MSRHLCGLSAVGILSLLLASPAGAQEEMVANPYYKFWAGAKPGATAVRHERTKLSGPEGKAIPGGIDESASPTSSSRSMTSARWSRWSSRKRTSSATSSRPRPATSTRPSGRSRTWIAST